MRNNQADQLFNKSNQVLIHQWKACDFTNSPMLQSEGIPFQFMKHTSNSDGRWQHQKSSGFLVKIIFKKKNNTVLMNIIQVHIIEQDQKCGRSPCLKEKVQEKTELTENPRGI